MFDFSITQTINYTATLVILLSLLYVIKFYFIYTPIDSRISERKFESKFSNFLYKISFKPPFSFLVEGEDTTNEDATDKVERLKKLIISSESSNIHNVRTLMTLQYFLVFFALFVFILNIIVLVHSEFVLNSLMNIQQVGSSSNLSYFEAMMRSLMLFMVLMITPLIPTLKMKKRVNKIKIEKGEDLPVLQMFIILFLRSNKTIEEMLFSMSKLNTSYKTTFEQAYRISVRDKREALEFLKRSFDNETFEESLDIIKELQDYAREDCLKIMESNLNIIVDELENNKRKSDLSTLIYSQAIIGLPFIAIILLVASPIVQNTFNILNNIGGGF